MLGPNGAGKTSTIRMMIGITVPDSGTVSLFGEPFQRNNLWKVGYLPEERGLYKKMNVLEQLVFFGRLRDLGAKISEKRARQKAEAVRRARKLARKRAQREGLIAAPAKR